MAVTGPQGQVLYTADEAYNLIGRHLYAQEWEPRFSNRAPIPDLTLVRRQAERGVVPPPEVKAFLEADPEEAEKQQAQRRRQDDVFKELLNALIWGKADCWRKESEQWGIAPPYDWYDESQRRPELERLLRQDLLAVLSDGMPPPRRILLDKSGLDKWVKVLGPPDQQSPLVPPAPKPAHRPPADWAVFRAEFDRRCEHGLVDTNRRGWASGECRELETWYKTAYPDAVKQKRAPKADTIHRELRPELGAYERRMKNGKSPG